MIILAASKLADGNGAEAAVDQRKGEQLRVIYWLGSNVFHGGNGRKTVTVTKEGQSLEILLNSIDSRDEMGVQMNEEEEFQQHH